MITKEDSDKIVLDLVEALYVIPLEELEEIRRKWLSQTSVSPKVIAFCIAVADAVIEYKQEEERTAI